MAFGKRFPKDKPKSNYPVWEEVKLSKTDEAEMEEAARKDNVRLMVKCLDDAKALMHESGLREYDNNRVSIAIALFEKLASHSVYWKEALCKEKFDEKNQG